MMSTAAEIRFPEPSLRVFESLEVQTRRHAAYGLKRLATVLTTGDPVKEGFGRWRMLTGPDGEFASLNAGHHRLMCDLHPSRDPPLVVVLGIVHRSRLTRWVWSGSLPSWRNARAEIRDRRVGRPRVG